MGINIGIVVIVVTIGYSAGLYSQATDVEIWNGKVTDKKSVHVSCSHSYTCNCRTETHGSGENEYTTTECDTCYEHSYDVDWNLYTDIKSIISISRVDRQGLIEPDRFTKATIGDPVAVKTYFTNYIKAAPDTLFNLSKLKINQFTSLIPEYPSNIYDYHYLNRVLAMGVRIPDLQEWNLKLAYALEDLGPKKQANVIILFVNTSDRKYYNILQAKWLGGKKNDIVVIIGVTKYPIIDWVEVMSWTKNELFKTELKDSIYNLKEVNLNILDLIHYHTMRSFQRRHMEEFEYLKDDIEPSFWLLITLFIVGTGVSVFVSYKFYHEDF